MFNTKLLAVGALLTVASTNITAQVTPKAQMEQLSRGVVALPSQGGSGMFISWRMLGTDDEATTFDVLRNGTVIAADLSANTCLTDMKGTATSTYQVVAKVGGTVVSTSEAVKPWSNVYTTLQLDRPSDGTVNGTTYSYTPNDCSVGDVDGDGEYELIVKWDPSNSKDNANTGYSGNVIIDCYELSGEKLWRIDLGRNIRAGAHYTQFLVYDFDGDGHAEMICKTAPGSVDGKGNYVTAAADESAIRSANNSTDYSASNGGRILSGPEYLTVFNGQTGAAIHTIYYRPNRAGGVGGAANYPSSSSFWGGDTNGNRGDRHLAAVAHLDGAVKKASGVFTRGYYKRAYLWAVDFDGSKLTHRWLHCSSSATAYSVTDANGTVKNYSGLTSTSGQGSGTMFANGNHNLSVADVDGDGKDEIIWGSAACDDNGQLLYGVGFGHGDAMHLADHLPDRPGLEVFDVHEEKGTYAWDLHDALTGEVLLKGGPSGVDNGRGMAAQYDANVRASYFSSSADNTTRSCIDGSQVSQYGPTVNNFRIYWDGDLQEELLGDISNHNNPFLEKWNGNGFSRMYIGGKNLYQIGTSMTINSTKGNPCLQADILGDWREEIIFYDGSNPSVLNIFTTNIPTNYRVVTLMHDHVYRMGIAWQNVAYNQPPHLGYYLPDYAKAPEVEYDTADDSSLKLVYDSDYDSQSDASSWHIGSVDRGTLQLVQGDEEYGKYIQYTVSDRSNSAYTLFSAQTTGTYVIQFDAMLTPGTNDGSEFQVMSEGGKYDVPNSNYWQSYAAYNNNVNSLFTLQYDKGLVGTINYTAAATATLPANGWCHYRLTVNPDARTVEYRITEKATNIIIAKGTYSLPAATKTSVQGIYVLNGRYNGSTKVDNVTIKEQATEEPGPQPGTEPVDAELYFDVESQPTAVVGKPFTAPTLVNPQQLPVTYTSSNEAVATVAADGTVRIIAAGETIITASFEGNDEYLPAGDSYKLTVTVSTAIDAVDTAAAGHTKVYDLEGRKPVNAGKGVNIVRDADGKVMKVVKKGER